MNKSPLHSIFSKSFKKGFTFLHLLFLSFFIAWCVMSFYSITKLNNALYTTSVKTDTNNSDMFNFKKVVNNYIAPYSDYSDFMNGSSASYLSNSWSTVDLSSSSWSITIKVDSTDSKTITIPTSDSSQVANPRSVTLSEISNAINNAFAGTTTSSGLISGVLNNQINIKTVSHTGSSKLEISWVSSNLSSIFSTWSVNWLKPNIPNHYYVLAYSWSTLSLSDTWTNSTPQSFSWIAWQYTLSFSWYLNNDLSFYLSYNNINNKIKVNNVYIPITFDKKAPTWSAITFNAIWTGSISVQEISAVDASSWLASLWAKFDLDNGTTTTSFINWSSWTTFTGLSINTAHSFKVETQDSAWNVSYWSNPITKYTYANSPLTPTVTPISSSSFSVLISPNSNPSNTTYAVAISSDNWNTTNYIQSSRTTWTSALYQTCSSWGMWSSCTTPFVLTWFSWSTSYQIKTIAKNWDWISTSFSPSSLIITYPSLSNKIAGGNLNNSSSVKSDWTIWTWGDNTYWQIWDGTTTQRNSPTLLSLTWIVSTAFWGQHVLALKSDWTVWAWGTNVLGRLWDWTTTQRNSPIQVTTLTGIVAVSAWSSHSVALKYDWTVWAWGDNWNWRLGDWTTTNHSVPTKMIMSGAIAISRWWSHTLSLKSDWTVWAWGYNWYWQVWDGTLTDDYSPVQISLSSVIAISAGSVHSLALKSDWTVWAWGQNTSGRLWDWTNTVRKTPVLTWMSSAIAIAAWWAHSIAIKSDWTVWAWGDNTSWQIWDGTTTQRWNPVQVSVISNAVWISAWDSHSLALKEDWSYVSWGSNGNWQLWDWTTTQRTTIVPINYFAPTLSWISSSSWYIIPSNQASFPLTCSWISDADISQTLTVSYSFDSGSTWYTLWTLSSPQTNSSVNGNINLSTINPTWFSWDWQKSIICKVSDWTISSSSSSPLSLMKDTTAPTTSTWPTIYSAATATWISITQTINETGTWYYLLLRSGSSIPSASNVTWSWNSFAMSANTGTIVNISGLSEKTSYTYYFIAKDIYWNLQSSISTGLNFTTADITPPITTAAPSISTAASGTTVSITQTINEDWLWYYIVQPAANAAPSVSAVKAWTSFAMNANTGSIVNITGLTSQTSYKYYFVAVDTSWNTQAAVSEWLAFTTTDITPPTTTSSPSISTSATATTISITQTINESGTWYYYVLPAASGAPSVSTVMSSWTSFSMSANSWAIVNITSLSEKTDYKYYFVAKDTSWNIQTSVSTWLAFTTADITPPVTTSAPAISTAASGTTVSVTQTINETWTWYYLVQLSASGAPSAATVTTSWTAFSMAANSATIVNVTGLTSQTSYKYYFVAKDTSWNTQAAVSTWLAFTTTDITPPTTTSTPSISTSPGWTTVSVTQTINETWTWYYLVQLSASGAPSVSTVTTSWTAFSMAASSATIVNITGLTSQTSYKYYFVAADTSWNVQTSVSTWLAFTTADITPPTTTSAPSISTAASGTTVSVTQTINETGTWYYYILPSASGAPSVSTVTASWTAFAMSANSATIVNITGLTSNTSYKYYFVAKDTSWNTQAAVSTWLAFSTTIVDNTPPTTTSAPSISTAVGWTTISITQTVDETRTWFYYILPAASWAPSVSTVMSSWTSFSMSANSWAIVNITGLTENTAYKYYFVAEDIYGNIQTSVSTWLAFTTLDLTAPTTTSLPAISWSVWSTYAMITQTINENWLWYYVVLPSASAAPSVSTVKLGTSFAMTGNSPAITTIDWLTPWTSYKYYFVAMDTSNNTQVSVSAGLAFTTTSSNLYSQIALWLSSSTFLLYDGTIKYVWSNIYWQLGNWNNTDQTWSIGTSSLTSVREVKSNQWFTYYLMTDWSVKSTWQNWDGELWQGNTTNLNTPTTVSWLSNVSHITTGWYDAYFLFSDWTVKATGQNGLWEFWLGNSTQSNSPISLSLTGVSQIASWNYFAVFLMNDWTVKAAGHGLYWKLWNWDVVTQKTPVVVTGVSNVAKVATWWNHALYLLKDGTVKSVGYNWQWQLWIWNKTDQSTAVRIPWLTGVVDIVAWDNFSLFLMNDWTVKGTWQNNDYQLATGNTTDQTSPITISGLSNVIQMAAKSYSAEFLLSDWTVKVIWQSDSYKLGLWSTANVTTPTTIPSLNLLYDIVPPVTTSAPSISTAASWTTVSITQTINESGTWYYYILPSASWAPSVSTVTASGTAFAMSANSASIINVTGLTSQTAYKYYFVAKDTSWNTQAAVSTWLAFTTTDNTPPTTITSPYISTVVTNTTVSVSQTINEAGTWYYIIQPAANAVPSVATVLAWTPFVMSASTLATVNITGLTPWTQYKYYFVAVDTTWNTQASVSTWIPITTFSTIQIASSYSSSYFVMYDGTIRVVWDNSYWQLWLGNTTNQTWSLWTPSLTTVKSISASDQYNALYLMNDWTVKGSWQNSAWVLGIWNTTQQNSRTNVLVSTWVSLTGVTQITIGEHSLFLMNDWTVKASGYNAYGELWNLNTTSQSYPTTVLSSTGVSLTGVAQIAAGLDHSLFLMNDWTVKSVWRNDRWQLWNWSSGWWRITSLVTIAGLSNVRQIAASYFSSFFLLNDGTVKDIWRNNNWQLWNWSTAGITTTLSTLSLTGVIQIVSENYSTFFLMSDWTVKAAWSSAYDQLWQGNTSSQLSPVTITWLSNVKQIAANGQQVIFLLNDWSVKVLWENDSYQLWQGNATTVTSPTIISWLNLLYDIVPPVTTSAPAISTAASGTTVSVTQTINETWTWYYLIQLSASGAPSAATVTASWTAFAMTGNSPTIVNVTGLTSQTAYKYYFIAADTSWNVQSSVSTALSFTTTDITPPTTTSAPSISTAASWTTVSITQTINETGLWYYIVQPAASWAPSVATVKAGTSFAMTANSPTIVNITGLTSQTAYKYYFVAADSSNNVQLAVSAGLAFTTTDITPPTTSSAPSISTGPGGTTVSVTQTINETWTWYYYYIPSSSHGIITPTGITTGYIVPSVSAWQLTLSLVQSNGSNPTSWSPVIINDSSGSLFATYTSNAIWSTSWSHDWLSAASWVMMTFYVYVDIYWDLIASNLRTGRTYADFSGAWSSNGMTSNGVMWWSGTWYGHASSTPVKLIGQFDAEQINNSGTWSWIRSPSVATLTGSWTAFSMAANSPTIVNVTGLTSQTDYKYYFVAADTSWNVQSSVSNSLSFTTADITPPTTSSAPSISTAAGSSTVSVTQTINETGTWYYYILPSASGAPSVATVTRSGTAFAMTANSATIVNVTGLTASTSYKYYFVAKDISWNVQAAVSTGLSFATTVNYMKIAASSNSSFFITSTGTLKDVGDNSYWILGNGNTTQQTSIINPWLTLISGVYGWWYHTLYLMNDWTVKGSWYNQDWELGYWNYTSQSTPVVVSWLSNVIQVAGGMEDSYFLMSDWSVKGTWFNSYWELWLSNTTKYNTPQTLTYTWIIQVAAWQDHALFLKNDGTVKSSGYNWTYQLGNWNTIDQHSPYSLSLTGVTQVSAWVGFSLFLMIDWTVKGVWRNNVWQLGIWNNTNQSSIITVTGLSWVKQIAAWDGFSLFLMSDWTVRASWQNARYQLWDWTATNRNLIVTVSWLSNVKQIAAWGDFDIFWLNDWTVKVLGSNNSYNLWLWTNTTVTSPTTIPWLNLN